MPACPFSIPPRAPYGSGTVLLLSACGEVEPSARSSTMWRLPTAARDMGGRNPMCEVSALCSAPVLPTKMTNGNKQMETKITSS